MNPTISRYMAKIGRIGGKAGTGPKKARSKDQARKAALARWAHSRRINSNKNGTAK
jgi:hypothetical protein